MRWRHNIICCLYLLFAWMFCWHLGSQKHFHRLISIHNLGMDGLAIHINRQNFKILIMKSMSIYILVLYFEMGNLIAQTTSVWGTAPECLCFASPPMCWIAVLDHLAQLGFWNFFLFCFLFLKTSRSCCVTTLAGLVLAL